MRVISILCAAATLLTGAEDAIDLFQRALTLERVQGELTSAIKLYQRIATEYASNRKLSAQALLQMASCHERMGQTSEAQKVYQKIAADFGDANEGTVARARLAEISPASQTPATAAHRLWSSPDVRRGGLSPDGRLFAFSDSETGDLAIRNLVSGVNKRLTNKGPWTSSGDYADAPVFSPDGQRIAFCWFVHRRDRHELRLAEVNGAVAPRVVMQSEDVYFLEAAAWSKDQKEILAAIQRTDGTGQIAWVAMNGRIRVLRSMPGWRYPERVRLSPDGRFIAYSVRQKDDTAENDIFLLSSDGSREVPVVEHPSDDSAPVWTPDGRRLLFTSNRTGSRSLWAVEIDGGKPKGPAAMVRADGMSLIGFSHDGSLYYSVNRSMSHVFVAELDPETGKLVKQPQAIGDRYVGTNFAPTWSRDGEQLAYLSRRGRSRYGPGSTTIVVRSTRSGLERDVPSRIDHRFIKWFPDNRSLLVVAPAGPKAALHRINPETGASELIISESSYVPDPEFSPDGSTLYYLHGTKDGVQSIISIRARDLARKEERVVLSVDWNKYNVRNPKVSPDGRQLVYQLNAWKEQTSELRVISLSGGESRVLLSGNTEELSSYTPPSWSGDGRFLFCFRGNPKTLERRLWRLPLDGGEAEPLELAARQLEFPHTPANGNRIAYSHGEWGDVELWAMRNPLADLLVKR